MPERMGRYVLGDTGELRIVGDQTLNGAGGEAKTFTIFVTGLKTTVTDKQGLCWVGASTQVGGEAFGCFRADKDRAVFLSFTSNHELSAVEVDMISVEVAEFTDA